MTIPPANNNQSNQMAEAEIIEVKHLSREQVIFQISIVVAALFAFFAVSFLISVFQQFTDNPSFLQYIALTVIFALGAAFSGLAGTNKLTKNVIVKTYILLASFQLTLILFSAIVKGMGIPVAFIALIFTIIIASSTSTGRDSDISIIIGILSAMIIPLVSVYSPFFQLSIPSLEIYIPTILGILVMVYIVLLAMEFVVATLRIKLISGALAIVLIPVVLLSVIDNNYIRTSLNNQHNDNLKLASSQTANVVDQFFSSNLYLIQADTLLPVFANYLNTPIAERTDTSRVTYELQTSVSALIKSRQDQFVTSYALLDRAGLNVFDTDRKGVYLYEYNTDYFNFSINSGMSYVTPITYDYFIGNIVFSAPVRDEKRNIIGLIRIKYNSTILSQLLQQNVRMLGNNSYPILVDENFIRIGDPIHPSKLYNSLVSLDPKVVADLKQAHSIPWTLSDVPTTNNQQLYNAIKNYQRNPYFVEALEPEVTTAQEAGYVQRLHNFPGYLVYVHDLTPLNLVIDQQSRISTLVTILIAGLISMISIVLARMWSNPILHLTETAEKITKGDLSIQANVDTNDEIETLGNSFNVMTAQLRQFINELEDRVNARTKELAERNEFLQYRSNQLQTVSEVARGITTTQELGKLLENITTLVSERFGFYHVGIFLVDEKGEYAILRAANSEGGKRMLDRQHKLKVGQVGIVGYVTGKGAPRIATDVGEDSVFFNNPDLPLTRSEMALPLKAGEQIIGAMDVQSTQSNAFTEEDVELFTTLADQIAVAIINNRLYEETAHALEEMQTLHRQYLRQEWSVELSERKYPAYIYTAQGITSTTDMELADIQKVIETGKSAVFQATERGDDNQTTAAMAVPIILRGETIGVIHLQDKSEQGRQWSEDELVTVRTVADQIAQSLETARLMEQTIRRAERERRVLEITNKIRSTNDPQTMLKIALEELQRSLKATQAQVILQPSKPVEEITGSKGNGHSPESPALSGDH
jgi:GAF domain-containing protein/HAMP domain-containing protein